MRGYLDAGYQHNHIRELFYHVSHTHFQPPYKGASGSFKYLTRFTVPCDAVRQSTSSSLAALVQASDSAPVSIDTLYDRCYSVGLSTAAASPIAKTLSFTSSTSKYLACECDTRGKSNVSDLGDASLDSSRQWPIQPIGNGASFFLANDTYHEFLQEHGTDHGDDDAAAAAQLVPTSNATSSDQTLGEHQQSAPQQQPSQQPPPQQPTQAQAHVEAPYRIAASLLGTHTLLGCNLFLKRAAKRDTPRFSRPFFNTAQNTLDLLHEANILRGEAFEADLLTALNGHRHVLDLDTKSTSSIRGACSMASSNRCSFERIEVLEENLLFSAVESHFTVEPESSIVYVYQAVLRDVGGLVEQYGLRAHQVQIALAKPDFLRIVKSPVDGRFHVTIIDAKSSKKLKASHQIQVSFYAMLLRHLIASLGLTDKWIIESAGEIWLPISAPAAAAAAHAPPRTLPNTTDEPASGRQHDDLAVFERERTELYPLLGAYAERFPTDLSIRFVERFLRTEAPRLFTHEPGEPERQVEWFLTPTCAGCQYVNDCKTWAAEHSDLNAIPYMSRADRRWAKARLAESAQPHDGRPPSSDIEDLYQLVTVGALSEHNPDAPQSHRVRAESAISIPSLELWRQPPSAGYRIATLGKPTTSMPVRQDVAVYLTLQVDPLTQQPCFGAIRVAVVGELPRVYAHFIDRKQAVATSTADNRVVCDFVQTLAAIIHEFARSSKSVQFYTWNAAERATIIDTLLQVLLDSNSSSRDTATTSTTTASTTTTTNSMSSNSLSTMASDCLLVLCDSPAIILAPKLRSDIGDSPSVDTFVAQQWHRILDSMSVSYQLTDSVLVLEARYYAASIELNTLRSIKSRHLGCLEIRRALASTLSITDLPPTGGDTNSSALERALASLTLNQLQELIKALKKSYERAVDNRTRRIGKSTPRIATILEAIKALVVLRVPGFYTLRESAQWLACENTPFACLDFLEDSFLVQLWHEHVRDQGRMLCRALEARLIVLSRIVEKLQALAPPLPGSPTKSVLIADASPCRIGNQSTISHPYIRKLLFMNQYERILGIRELLNERIYGKRTVRLQYRGPAAPLTAEQPAVRGACHRLQFDLLDGVEFLRESDSFMGDYLLVLAPSNGRSLQQQSLGPECQFPDLLYANKVIEQLSYCSRPDDGLFIADIENSSDQDGCVVLRIYSTKGAPVGGQFILRRRYVDFNSNKLNRCLHALDASTPTHEHALSGVDDVRVPLFIRLLLDPNGWGQAKRPSFVRASLEALPLPPDTKDLNAVQIYDELVRITAAAGASDEAKRNLGLSERQTQAFQHAADHRLQLVWGPPGTGKSHYLAVSMVRWLEIAHLMRRPLRILVVAFTNTAVNKLIGDLNTRVKLWAERRAETVAASSVSNPYRAPASIKVCRLSAHATDTDKANLAGVEFISHSDCNKFFGAMRSRDGEQSLLVVGSTVWQLEKLKPAVLFDALVIDEGSQLPLIDSAIALQRLKPDADRVIVAGDHLQLPPIIQASYPLPEDPHHAALYGSVLHGLMRDELGLRIDAPHLDTERAAKGVLTVKLTENRRSNRTLSNFTQRLYGKDYEVAVGGKPKRLLVRHAPEPGSIWERAVLDDSLASIVTVHIDLLKPTYSIATDHQLAIEADLVSRVVKELVASCAPFEWLEKKRTNCFSCFVVTPHRNQRAAVNRQLRPFFAEIAQRGLESQLKIMVDTVERTQGQEADAVIVSLGILDADRLDEELDFIYNLQRLNVAFSRAIRSCILVASKAVLMPDVGVLASVERSRAYSHLLSFVADSNVELSCTYSGDFDDRQPLPPQVSTVRSTATSTTTSGSTHAADSE